MPDLGHHLDVIVRDGFAEYDLHARLLFVAHRCIASGHPLAVAWPQWQERPPYIGRVFRAFGSPAALEAFADGVRPLVAHKLALVRPLAVTPEATQTVTFYRDRSTEKRTPGYVARENRHRQARGLRETSRSAEGGRPGIHFLRFQSGSTSQSYSMFIGRDAESTRTSGASFGLGIPVPVF